MAVKKKVATTKSSWLQGSIEISDTNLTVGETATVTVYFNQDMRYNYDSSVGFTLSVPNGILSNATFSSNGKSMTYKFTPTANITDTTNVISATFKNGNQTMTTSTKNFAINTVPVDKTAPTATITMSDTDLRAGETATVTIKFSEKVKEFELGDLKAEKGTLSALQTSDYITWTAKFTPLTNISDTTNVITLANTYKDSAGNTGTTATSQNFAINTVPVDKTAPTATITMSDTDLRAGETATVTIKFSEKVKEFELGDLKAENGTLSNLKTSDDGKTWTAKFTPQSNTIDSTNVITLANTYKDSAGNTGTTATSQNFTIFDMVYLDNMKTSSGVAHNGSFNEYWAMGTGAHQNFLKKDTESVLTMKFTNKITNFDASDITITNGELLDEVLSSDGGITWTAIFRAKDVGESTIELTGKFSDLAGNEYSLNTVYTDFYNTTGHNYTYTVNTVI